MTGFSCPYLVPAVEHPVVLIPGGEVFVVYPVHGFVRMSPFGPLQDHPADSPVNFGEHFLAANMPVVVSPTPQYRIQLPHYVYRLAGDLLLEDRLGFAEHTLYGLF